MREARMMHLESSGRFASNLQKNQAIMQRAKFWPISFQRGLLEVGQDRPFYSLGFITLVSVVQKRVNIYNICRYIHTV